MEQWGVAVRLLARMAHSPILLLMAAVCFGQAQPDVAEQKSFLESVRSQARQYVQNLPNFVCLQTTIQQNDTSGTGEKWKHIQTIEEQLNFFQHSESYEVLRINGKPVRNSSHDTVKHLRSSGEFGGILNAIFAESSHADFQWERGDLVNGQAVQVFSYRIAQANSKSKITHDRTAIVTAYHGLVYADAGTGSVLRYTKIEDLPPDFAVQSVSSENWSGHVSISGQDYLLPVKSETRAQSGKTIIRNLIEFSRYSKFDAQTSITFGDDVQTPAAKKKL
jgi:hypothetical protein